MASTQNNPFSVRQSQDGEENKKIKHESLGGGHPIETPSVESKEILEKKSESGREDVLIEKEIRKEIEMMDIEGNLKNEAAAKAKKLGSLEEEEKIKHLLQIAKEKGVIYAVKVAQSMNDPYILDMFHDFLSREGYYKQFLKK